MKKIPERLINTFRKYDTPTIVNSLELLDSKFRTSCFTTEQMICVDTSLPPIKVMPERQQSVHLLK